MPFCQMDIKNAFLRGDLQEDVYMSQPPRYVVSRKEQLACRVRKTLYGLKQSPQAWFDKLSTIVLQYGFQHPTLDHSVFTRRSSQVSLS